MLFNAGSIFKIEHFLYDIKPFQIEVPNPQRWQFFYSANPAFHIKHIQEIWSYRLNYVHCLMTNNIRALWYHQSGTFYGQLENMDFVPYVCISRIYYYIWILWNNVNVSHPDSRGVNLAWRSNSLSKFLLKFLNFQHSLIMLKITYEFQKRWKKVMLCF